MASVIRGSDNFDTTFMTVGSLATNGYTKLPNGMIIQWGTTASTSPSVQTTITFPISFPNSCLKAIGNNTIYTPTGEANVTCYTITNSQMYLKGGGATAQPYFWIAIGY